MTFIIIHMTLGQKLNIYDMTDNKGILPLKLGSAKLIENHLKLIHIVNLTDYENNINIIRNNVERLIDEIEKFNYENSTITLQKKLDLVLNSTVIIMKKKFNNLENAFDLIKPINLKLDSKVKRGIVDGLGTVIKTITGNMDNNDYHEINNHLKLLKLNQFNITNQLSKQIYINEKMIERFNKITDHINNQQNIIEKFNALIDKNSLPYYSILTIQYCNQIIYDIELLRNHLENILESINLAKLNVISNHILHPDEISYVTEIFKNQNINLVSKEDVYQFLELQAYYNETSLIFIIQIPTFYSYSYILYHLNQLPINNNITLNIEKPYIVINENTYLFLEKPCLKIENTFYCSKQSLQKIKDEDCIPNIINDNKAHCNFIEIESNDSINLIQPNYLLIISENEIVIESTCYQNEKRKIIKGIVLIYFENCIITINNIEYSSKQLKYWDKIEVMFTKFYDINKIKIIENLNMKKLHKFTLENLKSIELLTYSNNENKIYKIIIVILCLNVLIYISYKIIIKCKKNKRKVKNQKQNVIFRKAINFEKGLSDSYTLKAI